VAEIEKEQGAKSRTLTIVPATGELREQHSARGVKCEITCAEDGSAVVVGPGFDRHVAGAGQGKAFYGLQPEFLRRIRLRLRKYNRRSRGQSVCCTDDRRIESTGRYHRGPGQPLCLDHADRGCCSG